jgi:outer membrane protein assembly factor BamB
MSSGGWASAGETAMVRVPVILAKLASFILAVTLLRAEEAHSNARWPQFRGPDGLGVAPDGMSLPVHFGPDKNVLWKTVLASGHSSPCIWDERIFLTAYDKQAQQVETLCLDRQKGQILWRRSIPANKIERLHRFNSPAVATPAIDGERVYVYFGSFGLLCYDFQGNEQWRKPLPLPLTTFGTASSPVVDGDLVLLNREFQPDPSLMAVRKTTGETVWKKPRKLGSLGGPVDGYATPVIWRHDGVEEVVLHGKLRQTAYDVKDGNERWSVTAASSACSTPVIGDGRLFIATHGFGTVEGEVKDFPSFDELLLKSDKNGDGRISAKEFPEDLYLFQRLEIPGTDLPLKFLFIRIDTDKDGQISREEWDKFVADERAKRRQYQSALLAIQPGGHGDISNTHVSWREKRAIPEVPTPLYYRGRLYMVRDGGIVSCLDAKSGKLKYRERLGPGGAYFSSPVAGDGKIYAASKRGVVVVFAAGDEFKVLARSDFGEEILATPALADGKLYLRTAKNLYALGE